MKRALLIALCLAAVVVLSSCRLHIDGDPWPASPDYVAPVENAAPDDNDSFTQTVQQDLSTPTPQPSPGDVAPGLNG